MGHIHGGGGHAARAVIVGGVFLVLAAAVAVILTGWFSSRAVPALGPQLALAAPLESDAARPASDEESTHQEGDIDPAVDVNQGLVGTASTSTRRPPRERPASPEEIRAREIREMSNLMASEFPRMETVLRETIARAMVDIGHREHVDPRLLYAVIHRESRFKPNEVGAAGEIGLMQILPSTARLVVANRWGIKDFDPARLYDPVFNIEVGTIHLGYLLQVYDGDVGKALTAYNTGSARQGLNSYARVVLGTYERVTEATAENSGMVTAAAATATTPSGAAPAAAAKDAPEAAASSVTPASAAAGTRSREAGAHTASVNGTRR